MGCHFLVALIRLPSLLIKFEESLIQSLAEINGASENEINDNLPLLDKNNGYGKNSALYINTCTGNLLGDFVDQRNSDLEQPNHLCLLIAIFEYLCTMLSHSYFTIFSICLFISSFESKTLSNNLTNCPVKIHVFAWIGPFIQTCIVAAQKSVASKNTFPVMCKVIHDYQVTWLVPISVYLGLATIFLIISSIKFYNIFGRSNNHKTSISTAVCSFSSAENSPFRNNSPNGQMTQLLANNRSEGHGHAINHGTSSSNSSGNTGGQASNTGTASSNKITYSQRKYLDLYRHCVVRLSIFSILYLIIDFMYLASLVAYDSSGAGMSAERTFSEP